MPAIAPIEPTLWAAPETVPNSPVGNHSAASRSPAMRITEAPRPTSRRPANATPKPGASPKSSEPALMLSPPRVSVQRGPRTSARLPPGSAIAAKQYG